MKIYVSTVKSAKPKSLGTASYPNGMIDVHIAIIWYAGSKSTKKEGAFAPSLDSPPNYLVLVKSSSPRALVAVILSPVVTIPQNACLASFPAP